MTVAHVIFLHSHEGRVRICFGIAVAAAAHDGQLPFVCFSAFQQRPLSFPFALLRTFAFAAPVYEKDMPPFFLRPGTDGRRALEPCSFFQFRLCLPQMLLDGFGTGQQRFPALFRRCIPFGDLFRSCPPVSSQTDRTDLPPLPGGGPCGNVKMSCDPAPFDPPAAI